MALGIIMIKFVELECPNCGSRLHMITDKEAVCSYCGAAFLIDNDNVQPIINNIYTNNLQNNKKRVNKSFILFLFIMLIYTFLSVFYSLHSINSTAINNKNNQSTPNYSEEINTSHFKSDLFDKFILNVYGKSSESISADELSRITYLSIYKTNDIYTIDYRLNGGTLQSEEFDSILSVSFTDLKNFTGLKTLLLSKYKLSEGDLDGVTGITTLKSMNSPKELSNIIENPEKLKSLDCNFNENSAQGIDLFKNLTKLTINDYNLTNIDALSALQNLKSLDIDVDALSDFSVLGSLRELKHLSINAQNLKDISFIQNLKNLSEFELYDSNVLDIKYLSNISKIKKLVLYDNNRIRKYDVITSLNKLTELNISISSSQTPPDIGRLSNLKKLEIKGFDSILFLKKLPKLTYLSISGSSCNEYYVFPMLKNLKTLNLKGIYGDIYNLNFLENMEKLTSLNISSMSVYGNAESIFNIPNLTELDIDNCSMGLDFTNITKNKSLKILHMNNLKIMKNIQISYDGIFTNLSYDNVNLEDNISFLGNFPNITELYIQQNELTNVEFATMLKKLVKLDITDNYITDLRPLASLNDLSVVWCGENQISQGLDSSKKVDVIENSEP